MIEKKQEELKMYILTAKCKQAFRVAPEKTDEFMTLKCRKETLAKIETAEEKLKKNLKSCTYKL